MSIEGLGRKFQEARKARNLSLEEAARLTRIRQARLAETEAADFSSLPSLAYAKGFLQIYGKFLEVDVSPYLDTFETSGHITVDGYSYLQDSPPPPKSVRVPVARREGPRTSIMPLLIGLAVLFVGFWLVRLLLNVQRIAPRPTQPAFERWVSPSDGVVEFRGRRISVRVLDREAVQIRKNGKIVSNGDADLRIE